MKEGPILYTGEMVRALMDDRKTQTRRVLKIQQPSPDHSLVKLQGEHFGKYYWAVRDKQSPELICPITASQIFTCPYGQPGDRLWVRETFYAYGEWQLAFDDCGKLVWHFIDMTLETGKQYQYMAPSDVRKRRQAGVLGWWKRPSIFMPRIASRILLEVTDVRVERLQEISAEDVTAEGVLTAGESMWGSRWWLGVPDQAIADAVALYRELWERINGPGSWESNPWVWAISFKMLEVRG